MIIYEGDQFKIFFKLKDSTGTTITPSYIDNVRVKVNNLIFEYPDKGLSYDSTNQMWYFNLSQRQTICEKSLNMEVQAKVGGDNFPTIRGTKTKKIPIKQGIIKENW